MAMLFNCTTGGPYKAPEGFHANMLVQTPSGSALPSPDYMSEEHLAQAEQEQQMQMQMQMQEQAQKDLVPNNASLLLEMLEQQSIQHHEERISLRKKAKKENQLRFDQEMSM